MITNETKKQAFDIQTLAFYLKTYQMAYSYQSEATLGSLT